MLGFREVERIPIREDQRIEYVIAKQDPAALGPEARTIVTKVAVKAGQVLVIYEPDPSGPRF